jgi:DNA polymerase I
MKLRGWLLDPYIRGKNAVLWFKTDKGQVVKLKDRHFPTFIADPKNDFTAEEVEYLFEQHPLVRSIRIVDKYPTLGRKRLKRVVEVKVDCADDLDNVLKYAKLLPEVNGVCNSGLMEIQWHLIYRGLPPSSLCELEVSGERVASIKRMDDDEVLEPPPFTTMILRIPGGDAIESLEIYDEWGDPITAFKGEERRVLTNFQSFIRDSDPDVIVTDGPIATMKHVLYRAAWYALDLRFGRGGERQHGRVVVGTGAFYDMGLAGLTERARFTYAPMGVGADWEAGKTIDSRQCAEAVRMGVMVPPMRGGFGYNTSAWDLIRSDKGGMIFSPQPGLHENVAALDYESMFPNIIVRRNISYETVTDRGVSTTLDGFLGQIVMPFLNRRLRFKHLKKTFPANSREWLWCQQRQSTLKLFLVVYYGYSGCYANRFANVRVFQEINREARIAMVRALNIAQENGFEVIYGPFDSLFVKRLDATKRDFEELAAEITEVTELPMGLDRHFQYLVLLTKVTDPVVMAANRYYGKLTDGSLFYRGIELRRHDTPPFIFKTQKTMIETLFDAENAEQVLGEQLPKALDIAGKAYNDVLYGKVDPGELVISKRLRMELSEYKARQPHIVAAMLGEDEEMSHYILVNTESTNPFMRVMPASLLDGLHKAYDRKKYAELVRRAAWNILRPFVPNEASIGGNKLRESRLDIYF